MSKILKNTTLSDIEINDIGITVPASSNFTVEDTDYLLLSASVDITSLISSGDIVINDGSSDLSAADGEAYVRYPDSAENSLFDPSGSTLTETTTQRAIEELSSIVDSLVFGLDKDEKVKEVSESTSGSSFTTYDSITFAVTETTGTNTYRLNADCLWGHDSASNDIRIRVQLDGVTEKEIQIEPKDTGTDQRIQNNLLIYANNLSLGNHTFALQYRPQTASRVSYMYSSVLEVWRTK